MVCLRIQPHDDQSLLQCLVSRPESRGPVDIYPTFCRLVLSNKGALKMKRACFVAAHVARGKSDKTPIGPPRCVARRCLAAAARYLPDVARARQRLATSKPAFAVCQASQTVHLTRCLRAPRGCFVASQLKFTSLPDVVWPARASRPQRPAILTGDDRFEFLRNSFT